MGSTSTDHESPRNMHGEVSIAHDDEGKVWIGIHPPAGFRMMFGGEQVEFCRFPMSPEIATDLGYSIVDEARKAARLDQPGPHRHHVAAQMSDKRFPREQQAHGHSTIDIEHDGSGQVWLSMIPSDMYEIKANGEKASGIAFPLRPDQAAVIGQLILDETLKATGQAGLGAR